MRMWLSTLWLFRHSGTTAPPRAPLLMGRGRNRFAREGRVRASAFLERMKVQATQSAVVLDVYFERCEDVIVLRPRDHWPSGLKIVQVILGCWAACFAAYVSGQAGLPGGAGGVDEALVSDLGATWVLSTDLVSRSA